ncbi:MAG: response regulator transcription factor [Myxococcales bacterium FL481]|nr:MAG: response regulator transcription factor [Myxococcales bacterium FL481]
MRKTNTLTWEDAREIFNLVGELRELGHDLMTWRHHLAHRIARLVGAKVCYVMETDMPFNDAADEYLGFVDVGWATAYEREVWLASCLVYDDNPTAEGLRTIGDISFTLPRHHFADDPTWYRSEYLTEYCRGSNIDHFMISNFAIHRFQAIHGIQLVREWGETPFSPHNLEFVRRFHDELGRLWEDPRNLAPRKLPPYLRNTMNALAKGQSEKEIADHLGVRPTTVHGYVKTLYRTFRVHSRPELMARLHQRPDYPRLELTYSDRLGQVAQAAPAPPN